jgi:hypothetical protein
MMRQDLSDIPLALKMSRKVLFFQGAPLFVLLCMLLRVPLRPECDAIIPPSDPTFHAVTLESVQYGAAGINVSSLWGFIGEQRSYLTTADQLNNC